MACGSPKREKELSTILNEIDEPQDIKHLTPEELDQLAAELRRFIIKTVSETGGHLASNLGVVELTIALMRVFDFPDDKVVWDVGHQSYVYKILTGRKDQFCHLRQWQGLAGFPKTEESPYDSFNTGHSSTSISAALGLLRAAKQLGKNEHVIAVIGDGALTGGMAYEALNDAGQGDDNLIVILNDNQMSINRNVGGLAKHLNRLRTSTRYRHFKGRVESFLNKIPGIGKPLANWLVRVKNWLRGIFLNRENTMFENFGFTYYGPIDGHDGGALVRALTAAKEAKGPVLVHVCTIKGEGYKPAETEPQNYHGVAPFEIETGVPEVVLPDAREDSTETFQHSLFRSKSFTDTFSRSLQYFAVRDERIVGITAAMASGTGMDAFASLFPKRFYDVGIAEQHAVGLAAGLAAGGLRPVVAIYATFLQRALDQVQHDTVLQKLPVVFCIDRAGVVGEDGETHQGLYDLAFLRALPGGRIFAPRDYEELYLMMKYALAQDQGPTFIRYPKGSPALKPEDYPKISHELVLHGELHSAVTSAQWLRRGTDINLLGWGYTTGLAYRAAERLEEEGISAGVLDLRSVKPLDYSAIAEASHLPIVMMEEIVRQGSAGQEIALWLSEQHKPDLITCIHLPDEAILHGKRDVVLEAYGISAEHFAAVAKSRLEGETNEVRHRIRQV